MGDLIIGFLIGIALTYIILDQQISEQRKLIEKLIKDSVREKQKTKHYRTSLRLERQIYSESLAKQIKEVSDG
jgi:hypothetical protein